MSAGGNGGNGFEGDSAVSSRATIEGGVGGQGSPDGHDGLPVTGTYSEHNDLPTFAISGQFVPGGAFTVAVGVVDPGRAVLLFGDHGGFVDLPGNPGPPLSVVPFPGGRFVLAFVGHLGAGGSLTLPLTFPSDPLLAGFPVHGQVAILGDDGQVLMTNARCAVLGE